MLARQATEAREAETQLHQAAAQERQAAATLSTLEGTVYGGFGPGFGGGYGALPYFRPI